MNSLINVCEKLKFYREIHESGERTPYIDICKLKSDRFLLSKFRLSAHSLAIEKGRCSNIERQNRICLSCDTGEVENEYNSFSTFQH
jgi:ribosomal protein L32